MVGDHRDWRCCGLGGSFGGGIAMRAAIAWTAIKLVLISFIAWASFNAGFDLGSDTSACVMEVMLLEVEVEDSTFCDAARPSTTKPVYFVRKPWLDLMDGN